MPTITSRRRVYSSDDILNDGELPATLTLSEATYQSERVEEKGTVYPAEIPKESTILRKRQDNVAAEIQLPPKSLTEEQQPASLSSQHSLSARTEPTQISASLPRSYQKTDTARLTSVVTPRPFGTQSRGISPLPRSYTVKIIPTDIVCFRGWKVVFVYLSMYNIYKALSCQFRANRNLVHSNSNVQE